MNKVLPIPGKALLDVVTLEEYYKSNGAYFAKNMAIDVGYDDLVLPIISDTDKGPGIVIQKDKPFAYIRNEQDASVLYSKSNIVDFTNEKDMEKFMQKQKLVHKLENDILSSPDNIFTPSKGEHDSPAMSLLKDAITSKHIDFDKYESRFGPNFANTKRLFNKDDISLNMTVRICDNTDIKATLVLENADGDIANPMPQPLRIELTGQGGDDGE